MRKRKNSKILPLAFIGLPLMSLILSAYASFKDIQKPIIVEAQAQEPALEEIKEDREIVKEDKDTPDATTVRQDTLYELFVKVFNEDADLMYSIAKCESSLETDRVHSDYREHSVGLLQINLKAHSAKVPGETLEDKTEFLKVPKNNLLVGRFIKATQGVQNAWVSCYKKI